MPTIRAAIAVLSFIGLASAAAAQPPVEHYARLPAAQGVSISPDGTRIAFIANDESNRYVIVSDIATRAINAADASHLRAFGTFWLDDDTVFARVGQVDAAWNVRGDVDRIGLVRVDADTMRAERLIRSRRGFGQNLNSANVVGVEPDSGRFLMPLRSSDGYINLYAVDPQNGMARSLRGRGNGETRSWAADPAGARHVRRQYFPDERESQIQVQADRGWRTLIDRDSELTGLGLVGFTENGEALLISHRSDTAPYTRIVQEVSLEDGSLGDIVLSDDQYDYASARRDPYRGHVVRLTIERERPEHLWLDEELGAHQATLDAVFEDMAVTLHSWTPDRQKVVFSTQSDSQAAVYYVVDFSDESAVALRTAYPELLDHPGVERRQIHYTARDGEAVPAYLSTPPGEGPHPFVVLVHGGPAARDTGGFDYFASFLTSRGYGVIQPQYRGSGGFGLQWEASGWGEWGRGVMQHDVSDAAAFVIDEGLADQICIAGASYGGYAALAGAAFTPDLFDCVIAINALSDLNRSLDWTERRYGEDSSSVRYWIKAYTGEPSDQRPDHDFLANISPAEHADAITAPVLLLHGENDTVVAIEQARTMRRGLRSAGVQHRYVELDGGDHWLLEYDTRLQVLSEMERFLDATIGAGDAGLSLD